MIELRRTGRTTRQLEEAPRDAIFVCPNSRVEYPKRIAHRLGRTDIKFVVPSWVGDHMLCFSGGRQIVLDHETRLTDMQHAYLASYRKHRTIEEVAP